MGQLSTGRWGLDKVATRCPISTTCRKRGTHRSVSLWCTEAISESRPAKSRGTSVSWLAMERSSCGRSRPTTTTSFIGGLQLRCLRHATRKIYGACFFKHWELRLDCWGCPDVDEAFETLWPELREAEGVTKVATGGTWPGAKGAGVFEHCWSGAVLLSFQLLAAGKEADRD